MRSTALIRSVIIENHMTIFIEKNMSCKNSNKGSRHDLMIKGIQCDTCDTKFELHYHSYNYYTQVKRCASCSDKKRAIDSLNFDHVEMNPKLELHVTYTATKEEHDGYCSDHGDKEISMETDIQIFPLIKDFTKNEIDNDSKIDEDNWKLRNWYLREDEPHGNGYCGMVTRYEIISARVCKRGEIEEIRNLIDD